MTLWISDLAQASGGAHPGWKPVPYRTMDGIAGNMLYAPKFRPGQAVRIPLPVKGRYDIYLGFAASQPWVIPMGVTVKLERDPAFCRVSGWGGHWFWEIYDNYWKTAELDHDTLLITGDWLYDSAPAWIRLEPAVPMPEPGTKTLVVTNDGYAPHTVESLYASLMPLRDSAARDLLFCVAHGDVSLMVPSQVGTVPEYDPEFPYLRDYDCQTVQALSGIRKTHPEFLAELTGFVHSLGLKMHLSFRTGAVYMTEWPFNSRFFLDHPECRCRLFDGTPVARLSFAHPAVQEHFLALFAEFIRCCDCDGLNLVFTRALAPVLFEEPLRQHFRRQYGEEPTGEEDARVMPLRSRILTGFIREIRTLLDREGARRGRRLELSLIVPATEAVNRRHGLDLEVWAHAGLIDSMQADGSIQRRDHEERVDNIEFDYFARVCAGTSCRWYPRIGDATDDDAFLAHYRRGIASGASGGYLWDAPSNQICWNNLRHLDDDGARARLWYDTHPPQSLCHPLKTLDGFDADRYPAHVAY